VQTVESRENARGLDLRLVLGVLAVVSAAMAIWAATALAGGSSSPGSNEPATSPAAAFIQQEGETPQEEDDSLPLPGDCPEREGDGNEGSNDTSSSDL
jgi:hypothetical protein